MRMFVTPARRPRRAWQRRSRPASNRVRRTPWRAPPSQSARERTRGTWIDRLDRSRCASSHACAGTSRVYTPGAETANACWARSLYRPASTQCAHSSAALRRRLNLYTPQGLPVVGNPIARGEVVADIQSRQTQQRGLRHPQNPPHTAILVPHPPVYNGLLAVRREGVDWNLPDPDSRMTVETVEDVRGVLCNTRRLRTAAMPRRPYLLSNSIRADPPVARDVARNMRLKLDADRDAVRPPGR